MKLPTSDKTSNYGVKPHIKKGYYPGKLLKVEVFSDRDGNPKIGKYGQQLIFEFAVYEADPKTDAPIAPMEFQTSENEKDLKTKVVLSKFVYHMYKKTGKDKKWVEEEYQTAITPNSAITKVLKALGWTFSADGVDPEEFIGNWVELNVDDYASGEGDEGVTLSTIKDINSYKGPEVSDVEDVKASEPPKKVEKQVKHEAVKDEAESKEDNSKNSEEIKKCEDKLQNLANLKNDGHITEEGYNQAVEQVNSEIEELKKK